MPAWTPSAVTSCRGSAFAFMAIERGLKWHGCKAADGHRSHVCACSEAGLFLQPLEKAMQLESLSLSTLRRKAGEFGWSVRYRHNYNRIPGHDGFVIVNASRNYPVTEPLDATELREWLIGAISAEEYAT